ncbi:MAG: HypC/HybG/HupF family hydrogenase formation chaperone [Nitrososphaerales archaeon]|jgi:hydrogenase maturation factor
MCITRVGKVTSTSQGRASVDFFDGRALDGVDVSMVEATQGDFVEVFGNLALSLVTPSDAKKRRAAWKEIREAAIVALPKRDRTR